MPDGSCLCSDIRIAYEGDPVNIGICHCLDCRKLPGYGLVFAIPDQNFKITSGEPKVFSKIADSGREIHTYFCGVCGTALYRINNVPEMKDLIMLRAPVLDDVEVINSEKGKPRMEMFCDRRPTWMKPIQGAIQLNSDAAPTV